MSVPSIRLIASWPGDPTRAQGDALEADYSSMTVADAFQIAPALARWQRILRLYEGLAESLIRQSHADEAKRRA